MSDIFLSMLNSILIDNYALIDKLEMDFHKGLSIITGETGAGKSILIGALGLLLGKRADSTILKDKNRKCIVEGLFRADGCQLEPFFEENDLDYSDEIMIRREIAKSGKSRAFINDTPVNLNVLQELTLTMVDIHSQHQSLLLNKESYTRNIIDSYANALPLLAEYRLLYGEFKNLQQEYYKARDSYNSDKDNLDFISHQFTELREANLREGELEELEAEYKLINHAEEIKSVLALGSDLMQNDSGGILSDIKSVYDSLSKIVKHLPEAQDIAARFESAYIELKDLGSELSLQNERVEFDPGQLQRLTERMDHLYSLLRKYKSDSLQDLIDIRVDLDSKLQKYSVGDFELGKLLEKLDEKEARVNAMASDLSEIRKKHFSEFEKKVLTLLENLGMKNVKFTVHHENTELGENGIDRILFLFSANKNIPEQSIAKIASGGELSRLMLAIKSLISDSFGLLTIIFDEIDSGVSGDTADKVGSLIKDMSSNMQVINITHLPQVASKADYHYLVYKTSDDSKSVTYMKLLDGEERVNEIAKMLSGDSVSNAAIENAKVLLKQQ